MGKVINLDLCKLQNFDHVDNDIFTNQKFSEEVRPSRSSEMKRNLLILSRKPDLIVINKGRTNIVGWGCRKHRLHLCKRGKTPTPNDCPGYDTSQSPVMLELLGMRNTPSLQLLPGPLLPRIVAPDRALSGAIELTEYLC